MKKILIFIYILCLSNALNADDIKLWKNAAELSYVSTSGNTKTSTIAGKNLFNYDDSSKAFEIGAGGLGTKSDGVVTGEQFNIYEKVSIKYLWSNYAFERIGWNKDRFAGIANRWDMSIGIGRNIIDKADDKLSLELGGGYVLEDRMKETDQSFSTYRGYFKYMHNLSPTANASQNLEYLGNFKNSADYHIHAETSLITSISTHFSLKVSYVWNYANTPVSGYKKTDTTTSLAIIVNY